MLSLSPLLVTIVVVSHIQRVLVVNPKKLLYTVANRARGLLKQGTKKSLAATPPPSLLFQGK